MFEQFYPDEWLDSAYDIDYEGLYESGFRGLIFDIDNTLVPHGDRKSTRFVWKAERDWVFLLSVVE